VRPELDHVMWFPVTKHGASSETADKGWSSICGLGKGLTTPHSKSSFLRKFTQCLKIWWTYIQSFGWKTWREQTTRKT